jgi:hypothetical protein
LLPKIKLNGISYAVILIFFFLHPINVIARHSVALLQRGERNPQPVVEWVQSEIKDEPAIIMGHDIAYYAVAKSMHTDYLMFNLHHQKFKLDVYENYYILTDDQLPFKNIGTPKVYYTSMINLQHKLDYKLRRIPTYRTMYLYEVNDSSKFLKIKEYLDKANFSVNRD